MKKFFLHIQSLRNYLAYQIIASFGITVAILLGIALILPNLDARIFNRLEEYNRLYFEKESYYTQQEYNLDEIFRRGLHVTTINGFDVILLEKDSGTIRGADENQIKALQAFVYRADNPDNPLQRRFGTTEIYGPFLLKSDSHEYYQYFMQQVDPQREFINQIFDSPWLMLLILLVVSTPAIVWLAWRIAKPVKALRLSADAVASGNFAINPKLETEGIHELRQVGKSFNAMIQSLQDLSNYQHRLLSDISHELKTPLTRMQLAVSLIRRRNGESNELTRMENEIQKLDTMIHDLLAVSRRQVNQHLDHKIFPINKIWDDIFTDAKFETEQNNIDLFIRQRISFPDKYFINGNVATLSSAVENIIRNAQKYAVSSINVMIYIDKKDLFIVVDDDGAGVPENEYEQIFRPFYRVDEARDRQTGGTGLGLAIVASAVKHHNGSVVAEKSPFGGLRIKLQLPLWLE